MKYIKNTIVAISIVWAPLFSFRLVWIKVPLNITEQIAFAMSMVEYCLFKRKKQGYIDERKK